MGIAGRVNITVPFDERGTAHRQPYHSSGLIPLAQCPKIISTVAGMVGGLVIFSDGVNAVSATLKDSSTGKVIHRVEMDGADKMGGILMDVEYLEGLYLEMSGAGSNAIVYYLDRIYP